MRISLEDPKVSFIMPSIRDDEWFDIAVKSILDQSLKDIELIIINDNHQRRTDIFQDDRVRMIDGYGGGQTSKCLNKGINEARGILVCFAFDDDVVFPEMAEILYNAFQIRNADVIYGSYMTIDKTGELIEFMRFPIKFNYEIFKVENNMPIASNGFRLLPLKWKNIKFDENYDLINDSIFLYDCYHAGLRFEGISVPLMYYRLHNKARSKLPENLKIKLKEYQMARNKYNDQTLFERKLKQWG